MTEIYPYTVLDVQPLHATAVVVELGKSAPPTHARLLLQSATQLCRGALEVTLPMSAVESIAAGQTISVQILFSAS